jgi:hypothetical protein
MAAIGSLWAWLLLLSGVRTYLDRQMAHGFAYAMIAAGVIALPVLWHKETGPLRALAPSGLVRGLLSVMVLVLGGMAYPGDVMGLVPQLT